MSNRKTIHVHITDVDLNYEDLDNAIQMLVDLHAYWQGPASKYNRIYLEYYKPAWRDTRNLGLFGERFETDEERDYRESKDRAWQQTNEARERELLAKLSAKYNKYIC